LKYLLIILTLIFTHFSPVYSDDLDGLHTSEQYYWLEPEGETPNLYEVLEDAQWEMVQGELNFGYNQKKLWVMQTIDSYIDGSWVFEIPYPLLDYLDIYLLEDSKVIKQIQTGDARPFASRQIKMSDFILEFTTEPAKRYLLMIRIQTDGTMMMPSAWHSKDQYLDHLTQQQIIYGGYYGILLVMALYHLFIFLVVRERGYLFYVASVSAFMLLQMTFDGRGFAWFWPDNPSLNAIMFPISYCLYQLAVLSFMSVFLNLYQSSIRLHRYFILIRLIVLFNFTAIFWLPYKIVVPIIVVTGIIGILSGLLTGAYLWAKGFTAARFFTCALAVFLGGILIINFRGLGLGEGSFLTQYGYLLGSLLEVLLLAFSLADRINSANRQKRQVELQLIASQDEHLSVMKRYQELYENAPTGNFQGNDQYQFTSVNSACAHIFGFNNPEEMLKEVRDIRTFLVSNFSEYQKMIRDTILHGRVSDRELQICANGGQNRWISISMRHIHVNRIEGFEGAVQDISARKESDKMRLELDQERLDFMEQFSLGVAKEINSPLGSNVATTAFINEGVDDIIDKQNSERIALKDYSDFFNLTQKSLSILSSNQKRITRVVKRFRDVSVQHLGLVLSYFNLRDIIDETIASQRWRIAGWRVNVDCSKEIQMHSYKKAISLILVQLIENSLLHSDADIDQDPVIWVRAELDGQDNVQIVFSDNGQGISQDQAKNLGQPFFTTKQGSDGHIGLGLYMIYNLTSRMLDGRLQFPVTGNGFCVKLVVTRKIGTSDSRSI
jgi:PAS domain S-box-containing protein